MLLLEKIAQILEINYISLLKVVQANFKVLMEVLLKTKMN